ncbi:glutamate-rich protein 1 isoform X2 [Phyllostomus hastatus]|uniref:glutamate-rich protein 1 isoform X2 n=1 Tax=Phyllostomus hastatus TaxID=9423 RepID=UPI001E683FE1|nr:glutamate-rich protein 1 isoform X2 [Phyllostomus hastatus]
MAAARRRHGGGTEAPPGRKLYTVALPPEGYVPAPTPQELPGGSGSESTCSSEEDAGDQDPHDQPKRRRRRKQKTKRTLKPNNVHVEQAELEKQQTFPQETLQPRHTGDPTMSKNKKRKLKKKQQLRRKKAAGLLTKASGISFLYEPREDGCELSDAGEGAPGDAGDSEAEEASADVQEKADGILDFLKSTQEMYLYDGVSHDPDPAFLGAAEALFTGLEARSVCAADLLGLEQLKALLLLQDPGRLQRALQAFAEHCAMPPEGSSQGPASRDGGAALSQLQLQRWNSAGFWPAWGASRRSVCGVPWARTPARTPARRQARPTAWGLTPKRMKQQASVPLSAESVCHAASRPGRRGLSSLQLLGHTHVPRAKPGRGPGPLAAGSWGPTGSLGQPGGPGRAQRGWRCLNRPRAPRGPRACSVVPPARGDQVVRDFPGPRG